MDVLVIEGVRPHDGTYDFDLEGQPLTTREWGWIKRHSGYLPLTIDEGWLGRDPELWAAFAVVALYRAGKIAAPDAADVFDRIADAPFGSTVRIEFGTDDEEDDAGPPALKTTSSEPSSGDGSSESSGSSVLPLNPSGTTGSDDSESAQQRSAI